MTKVALVRRVVRSIDPKPQRMSTAHVAMLAAKTGTSMLYVRYILNGEGIHTGDKPPAITGHKIRTYFERPLG